MDTAKSLNDLSKIYLESVYSSEQSIHESGWHRRNPDKVGTPEDPDYDVLRGRGKPVKDSKPATTGPASKKPAGIYKPNKEGKLVKVDKATYPGHDEKGKPLKKEPKDNRHVVTYADKRGNTPAYQKLKAGDKNYKKADHLNNEEFIHRLEESGKFSIEEIQTILEAEVSELYKGKHGQSEKEYQAGRSDAGKRISGDDKHGPASYSRRGVRPQEPTKPGEKPKHTPKLGSAEKAELAYLKSRRTQKEEVLDEVKVTKLDDKKKKEERVKNIKAILARQAEWESGKKKALHASHEPEGEVVDETKVDPEK